MLQRAGLCFIVDVWSWNGGAFCYTLLSIVLLWNLLSFVCFYIDTKVGCLAVYLTVLYLYRWLQEPNGSIWSNLLFKILVAQNMHLILATSQIPVTSILSRSYCNDELVLFAISPLNSSLYSRVKVLKKRDFTQILSNIAALPFPSTPWFSFALYASHRCSDVHQNWRSILYRCNCFKLM